MNAFFLVCVVGGIAMSVLASWLCVSLGKTHAPVREPPTPRVVVQRLESDEESRKIVNKLMEDLQSERAAMQKREDELKSREEALRQQQEILTMLKNDLQQLQGRIDETIVRTSQSEQVNLKRLAEVYGKMDPDSVSTLLTKMETERAASILRLLGERQAGAVLAAAVASGTNGVRSAASWSDCIRRMAAEQGQRK
jgi:flagellar motility protein MotE (MotC chaperone)